MLLSVAPTLAFLGTHFMNRNIVGLTVVAAVLAWQAPAQAQSTPQKPRTMGEIARASEELAQRNEACREQASEQHLHFVKRKLFMHRCLHPK